MGSLVVFEVGGHQYRTNCRIRIKKNKIKINDLLSPLFEINGKLREDVMTIKQTDFITEWVFREGLRSGTGSKHEMSLSLSLSL